jgi:hypothetical protein
MHQRDDFLDRARRHLRLARLHQGLRDVTDEVTNVREALAAADSHPAAIGTTEEDLVEMLRNGHMAEARMLFDFTADSRLSSIEKQFFFAELVAQVVKAVAAAKPIRPTVREKPLTAAPVEEAPVDDATAASLLAEHDLSDKEGFVHWDTARASGEFQGIGAEDLEGLNFDAIGDSVQPPESGTDPSETGPSMLVKLGHDEGGGDNPDVYIEIGLEDCIESVPAPAPEPAPDPPVETPEYLRYCLRFFGEKDAIALGLVAPPILLTKRKRRGPPPLPRTLVDVASGDG